MDKTAAKSPRLIIVTPVAAAASILSLVCALSLSARAVNAQSGSLPAMGITSGDMALVTQAPVKAETSRQVLASSQVSEESQSSGQWQTVRMRVTAYCPCEKCCGQYADNVTACGHRIRQGDVFVAADKRYPFGTEMVIDGYANAEPVRVLDRGGAIRGDRLDVFFHTHREALGWGVRYIDVKVCVGRAGRMMQPTHQ